MFVLQLICVLCLQTAPPRPAAAPCWTSAPPPWAWSASSPGPGAPGAPCLCSSYIRDTSQLIRHHLANEQWFCSSFCRKDIFLIISENRSQMNGSWAEERRKTFPQYYSNLFGFCGPMSPDNSIKAMKVPGACPQAQLSPQGGNTGKVASRWQGAAMSAQCCIMVRTPSSHNLSTTPPTPGQSGSSRV